MITSVRAALLAFGLALVGGAAAPATAEPLTLRYSATWGGGPAADIRLYLEDDGPSFRNRLDIETVGLARLLSGFRARAVSEGEAGAAVSPLAFDAVYDSRRKRDKRIQVQFTQSPEGIVAEDGPLDSDTDPPLPEAFRRDVIDPLSCLTVIRRLIRARRLAGATHFTLAVYDGRRRFDVEATVTSVRPTRWTGAKIDTIDLRLLLRPVAGFGAEADDGDKPDAITREINASFTNDARAIPLRMSVPIAYVPAVITLSRDTRL